MVTAPAWTERASSSVMPAMTPDCGREVVGDGGPALGAVDNDHGLLREVGLPPHLDLCPEMGDDDTGDSHGPSDKSNLAKKWVSAWYKNTCSFVKDCGGGMSAMAAVFGESGSVVQAPSLTVGDEGFRAKVEAVHAAVTVVGL